MRGLILIIMSNKIIGLLFTCVIAIFIIEIVALNMGVNGIGLSTASTAIGGIGGFGYKAYKDRNKKKEN